MHIKKISIENFRLFEDIELCLEDGTTLIGGLAVAASFRGFYQDIIKSKSNNLSNSKGVE